jgi:hypothetical protein
MRSQLSIVATAKDFFTSFAFAPAIFRLICTSWTTKVPLSMYRIRTIETTPIDNESG